MQKIFLPILAAILLVGAGCGGNNAPVPGAGSPDNQNAAFNNNPCGALKTVAMDTILTPQDAASTLGGNWSEPAKFNTDIGCGFTLSSDEMPNAAHRFLFVSVVAVDPFMYDEIVKTKRGEVANVSNYEYKDAPNLGDEAFFQLPTDSTREISALLFVKKGNRIISINSRYATEAQLTKLGQTAANQW